MQPRQRLPVLALLRASATTHTAILVSSCHLMYLCACRRVVFLLLQFREVFLSPHHINIVMDYASGGSLFGYVQSRNRLREPLAR